MNRNRPRQFASSLMFAGLLAHGTLAQHRNAPRPQLVCGKAIHFELATSDGSDSKWPVTKSFSYEVSVTGPSTRVWLYATSPTLKLALRVSAKPSALRQHTTESPTHSPLCVIDLAETTTFSVTVTGDGPSASGTVKLHAYESHETKRTVEQAKELQRLVSEVKQLARSGEAERARQNLTSISRRILDLQRHNSTHLYFVLRDAVTAGLDLATWQVVRACWESIVEFERRRVPSDHADLQRARMNLATANRALGETDVAASLLRRVVEALTRTRPNNDPSLNRARVSLATVLVLLGQAAEAEQLFETAVASLSETREGSGFLLSLHLNFALCLEEAGDLRGVQNHLRTYVRLASQSEGSANKELQIAVLILARSLAELGEPASAKHYLEWGIRTLLPACQDSDREIQELRMALANVLAQLGDTQGARTLLESVVMTLSRSSKPNDLALQRARMNLAIILASLDELERARSLFEQVAEIRSSVLSPNHPATQSARINLAIALTWMGKTAEAQRVLEDVEAALSGTLPPDHPIRLRSRLGLAYSFFEAGETRRSQELLSQIVGVLSQHRSNDDALLGSSRATLALCAAALSDLDGARTQVRLIAKGVLSRMRLFEGSSGPRQAIAMARQAEYEIACAISVGLLSAPADRDKSDALATVFALIETARSAGTFTYRLGRLARRSGKHAVEIEQLRHEVHTACVRASRAARTSTSRETFVSAIDTRDEAHAKFAGALSRLEGATAAQALPSLDGVSSSLRPSEAAVSYWRYGRQILDERTPRISPSYVAVVVPADGKPSMLDLGPASPIEELAQRWHAGLASGKSDKDGSLSDLGARLRELVLDPVRAASRGATKLFVAPASALHLVPFDALPTRSGVVGDQIEVTLVPTLRGFRAEPATPRGEPRLLAAGAIDYDESPAPRTRARTTPETRSQGAPTPELAGIRGPPREALPLGDPKHKPLPGTRDEVNAIASLFGKAFADAPSPAVLMDRAASKDALMTLAPKARFLHLATHGFFAPESVPSLHDDAATKNVLGPGGFQDYRSLVRGFSPMVLCGLALAGANRKDASGGVDGVITAEELASFDLTGCELAVLSACRTNVGEPQRGSQGIDSLKTALHAAGVSTSITSLWAVSDKPTQELMKEFYRRLWILGEPAAKALWEAKRKLRAKQGPAGPYHPMRDWAGWVLTTSLTRATGPKQPR